MYFSVLYYSFKKAATIGCLCRSMLMRHANGAGLYEKDFNDYLLLISWVLNNASVRHRYF